MRNGKASLIFDIRYFSGRASSYLRDDSVTAYGRRLAWYLNSQTISLGAYHSLYIHFDTAMPSGEIAIDPYTAGGELWWLRNAHVGVAQSFPNVEHVGAIAAQGSILVLQTMLPHANAIIQQADIFVRQHASDLRFLLRETAYSRYTLKIAVTISAHPEPSYLYVTLVENATGMQAETSGLPIGPYCNGFDEASSVCLRDLEIGHSAHGGLLVDWCERIRTRWAATKPNVPSQLKPPYSRLVRRQ